MAGSFVDKAIKTLGTIFGSEKDDNDDDKHEATAKDTVPTKRGAQPQELDQASTRSKRMRLSSSISADEQRLFHHNLAPPKDSVTIDVPKSEWTAMSSSRSKPFSGGFRPRNNLTSSSPHMSSLQTSNSIGVNVRSQKRRKLDHEPSQASDGHDQEADWFDRETSDHPTLGRAPSVISLNSQSQETSSQHQRFRPTEYETHSRIMAPPKKTSRKPKSSASHERRSNSTMGTESSPVPLEDDDDLRVLEPPSHSQSARKATMAYEAPVQVQSSPVRRTSHNYPSCKPFGIRAGSSREVAPDYTVGKNGVRAKARMLEESPSRLNNTFVRDTSDAPDLLVAERKLRNKMKAKSTTNPTPDRTLINVDMSEDELATSQVNIPRSTPRKPAARRTVRSPSSGDITSTHFKKSPKEFNIKELSTSSVQLKEDSLQLHFSTDYKTITFSKGEKPVLNNNNNTALSLNSINMHKVTSSDQDASGVLLEGASSPSTKGKVWLEFHTKEDRQRFLDIITSKTVAKAVVIRKVDDERLHAIYHNTISHLGQKETSAKSASTSQTASSTNQTARQRSMAAQQGICHPEREVMALRRSSMKAEFSQRPVSTPAKRRSPSPEVRMEPPASTRSSRRVQQKDPMTSSKATQPKPKKWTEENGIPQWEAPLVYPATGTKRTTVEKTDIAGLDDDECLNDNLIMYCLRRLEENNTDLKDKVHIFNTYFYSSLTTNKVGGKGFNYDAVKRWTKNIDLFTYPYVIVPINQSYHWYLLIVCNLDKLERTLKDEDSDPEEVDQPLLPSQEPTQSQNDLEIPESPQESQEAALSQDVKRMSLETDKINDDPPPSGDLKSVSQPTEKKTPKFDPDAPTIITLDSLGSPHSAEIKYLKQYVAHEGADKRGLDFEYSLLKGVTAKGIPQQSNMSDCGVYLIGYVTALLKDPREFVRKVLSKEMDKSNAFADFDPARKREEIRTQLLELADEQKAAKKAKKREAYLAKTGGGQTPSRAQNLGSKAATPSLRSSPIKVPVARSSPVRSSVLPSSPIRAEAPENEPLTNKTPVGQDKNDEMLFKESTPRIGVSEADFRAQLNYAIIPQEQDAQDADDEGDS